MKSEDNEMRDFFASESELQAREGHAPDAPGTQPTDCALKENSPTGRAGDAAETQDDDEDDDRFNWIDGKEIVVHEQRALAVYTNRWGGIVIREERSWDDEEDKWIVLASPGAAYRLIEAIERELAANKERTK